MTAHSCPLPPWPGAVGSLYVCPCGRWHRVRWFHDDEGDLTWKGWQPMDTKETA